MFQEELEKLQLKIVQNQEILSQREVQIQSLGEKLGKANNRIGDLEKQVGELLNELEAQRLVFATSRAISEKVPKLEQDLDTIRSEKRDLLANLSSLTDQLDVQRKLVKEKESELSEALASERALREESEPLASLVDALKKREVVEAMIRGELKKLKNSG